MIKHLPFEEYEIALRKQNESSRDRVINLCIHLIDKGIKKKLNSVKNKCLNVYFEKDIVVPVMNYLK